MSDFDKIELPVFEADAELNQSKPHPSSAAMGHLGLQKAKEQSVTSSPLKGRAMTGRDLDAYCSKNRLLKKDLMSFLQITPNRWGTLVKRSGDGRDMECEAVPPTIDIIFRLLMAMPEFAPWKKATPKEIMELTGWSGPQLAFYCGNSRSAGERWANDESTEVSSHTTILLNLFKQIIQHQVPTSKVIDIVGEAYQGRIASDMVARERGEAQAGFSRNHLPDSWTTPEEQQFRRVRRMLRAKLDALKPDGKKMSKQDSDRVLCDWAVAPIEESFSLVDDLVATSSTDNKTVLRDHLLLGIKWLVARNRLKRALFDWDKISDELALSKSSSSPTAIINKMTSKKSELEANVSEFKQQLLLLSSELSSRDLVKMESNLWDDDEDDS